MKKVLFPPEGHFYKCNLHCHTTVSDGSLTPAEVKEAYRAAGYAAVAFTDHEVMVPHEDLCDEGFIALHGYETAVKERPSEHTGAHQKVYHLNLIALRQDNHTQPFVYPANMTPGNCRDYLDKIKYKEELVYEHSVEGVSDLIRRANESGFLVALNHPFWSLIPAETYSRLRGLHAVEICNTGCFDHGDRSAASMLPLLRRGARVVPVGGDDNHNRRGLRDSFGAYTVLVAPTLSYEALTEAYRKGDLFVSEGPTLRSIVCEDGQVKVTCSSCSRILLHSEGRDLRVKTGEGLTEVAFTLLPEKFGAYLRIELVDQDQKHAYSRAYFADEWSQKDEEKNT